MKEGKLIEFKPGLFGINPPKNLGIVIKRFSRKKETILEVFTIKGIQEMKANHATKRKFPDEIDIPSSMKAKAISQVLHPRLEHFIEKYGRSITDVHRRVHTDGKTDTGEKQAPSSDRELWDWCRKEEITEALSSKDLAMRWFDRKATMTQISEIEDVLNVCLPRGIGYFNVSGKPKLYTPISFEAYEAATQDISKLRRLRERLVEVEEIEDEEGNKRAENIPVALSVLDFTEDENKILEKCQRWMEELIMHKEFPEGAKILGGTEIFSLGKFNLRNFLQYLAEDWTETRFLLQPASAMTEFLLKTNYWNESIGLENITKRAVHENPNFTWDLDEEAQKQALDFPDPPEEPEEWERRTDLRNLVAFTVDPATARDFDQALSYRENNDGTYTLWVHIADVTHYVTPGSSLDRHAKQRATSVYLPHRVLPMHPPALSTGLCALQERVPRFAMTVQLDFSNEGKRLSYKIYESIVQVENNLSYEYVDEKLAENDPYWTGMLKLGNKIRENFIGLNIETKEARMTTSQPKLFLEIEEATSSMQMNEMFMVATNEVIGEFIRDSGHPGIYRCHPIPDQEDVDRFNDQMASLGIDYRVEIPIWPKHLIPEESTEEKTEQETSVLDMLMKGGKIQMGGGGILKSTSKSKIEDKDQDTSDSSEDEEIKKKKVLLPGLAQLAEEDCEKWMMPFRMVLARVKEVEDNIQRMVMNLTVLGMFGRAFYTPDNIGHFGLGSACYTHFTAPIRRYSDDIAHRIVKGILSGTATPENPIYKEEELDELTDHCSEQSHSADKLEWRVVGAGLAFMTRRPEWHGKINGIVTKILPRGFFLLLREVVEGKIRMSDFTNDEVIVDPSESIAFRKKKGARLRKIFRAEDWQEMLDEEEEPIEVLVKLGQGVPVRITARDYVEGNVSVVPASFSQE